MKHDLPDKVTLVEVGPRDGFQFEKQMIPTEMKVEIINDLVAAGLKNIQVLDISRTSTAEQRSTPWMTFDSLADCLDSNDPSITIEGHPAPVRAALLIRV